jgi:hypothetical protein
MSSTEEPAKIIARLCSERFDNAAIQYYLEESLTARDFRNRFNASFFCQYQSALLSTASESEYSDTTKLAEDFEVARENLDMVKREFDAWLSIVERWNAVDGFAWKKQKRLAARAALEVIEATRDLARAHGAIRFDPYRPIPRP